MGHTTAYNRIQQGDAIHERFDELDAGQAAIQRTVRAEASKNQAAAMQDAVGELEAAMNQNQAAVRAGGPCTCPARPLAFRSTRLKPPLKIKIYHFSF